jgi:hypothetical protein
MQDGRNFSFLAAGPPEARQASKAASENALLAARSILLAARSMLCERVSEALEMLVLMSRCQE